MNFLFPLLVSLSVFGEVSLCVDSGGKRVQDALVGRKFSVIGGGRVLNHVNLPREDEGELLELLQGGEGATPAAAALEPLPESYAFLRQRNYRMCYNSNYNGQGSCNSCWAFAVQNMVQARLCKWAGDAGNPNPLVALSPMNVICSLQRHSQGTGDGICDPRDIGSTLEFVKSGGVLKSMWLIEYDGFMSRLVTMLNLKRISGEDLVKMVDASKPSKEVCDLMMADKTMHEAVVKATPLVSMAPHSMDKMKRSIMVGGPVVGTMRLTWEFIIFTGSLFNPAGKLTFCRIASSSDTQDYCDPRKRDSWDEEQRMQQVVPSPEDYEGWTDTWYNHFVAVHGWGVKEGVKYMIIENSWGSIYTNDRFSGNNGVGDQFLFAHQSEKNPRNHFTTIAESLMGRGALEITSREYYFAKKPLA